MLDGLRSGRIFAVAGDLISELDVEPKAGKRTRRHRRNAVRRRRDSRLPSRSASATPRRKTRAAKTPASRAWISSSATYAARSPIDNHDRNATTKGSSRDSPRKEWERDGDNYSITMTPAEIDRNMYVRVRGTSTADLEPPMDTPGESPWADLWFYSNPIFVEIGVRD